MVAVAPRGTVTILPVTPATVMLLAPFQVAPSPFGRCLFKEFETYLLVSFTHLDSTASHSGWGWWQ